MKLENSPNNHLDLIKEARKNVAIEGATLLNQDEQVQNTLLESAKQHIYTEKTPVFKSSLEELEYLEAKSEDIGNKIQDEVGSFHRELNEIKKNPVLYHEVFLSTDTPSSKKTTALQNIFISARKNLRKLGLYKKTVDDWEKELLQSLDSQEARETEVKRAHHEDVLFENTKDLDFDAHNVCNPDPNHIARHLLKGMSNELPRHIIRKIVFYRLDLLIKNDTYEYIISVGDIAQRMRAGLSEGTVEINFNRLDASARESVEDLEELERGPVFQEIIF